MAYSSCNQTTWIPSGSAYGQLTAGATDRNRTRYTSTFRGALPLQYVPLLTQHISIYLDCLRDDSYTPTKILVRAGTHPYDLVDVRYREFVEPQGWYHFMLSGTSDMEPEEAQAARASSASMPLRAIELFVLQVNILGNHLNGKDSHIRCMKVFGPTPPGIARPPAQPEVQRIMTERLLEQGKNTHAFHRQVERVGHERAVAQLERILQQHPHAAFAQAAPTRAHTAQRSLLHLSHTLR